MTPEQEKQVRDAVQALWAHDPWMYGFTCAELLNHEIDFKSPAIVRTDGGHDKNGIEYIEARVICDGKEFEINYRYGGWSMGFVTPTNRLLPVPFRDERI